MSNKIITKKDVAYVAKLARIDIPEKDQEKYEGQLERILGYVSQLKEKNTDNVKSTAHPHDVANVMREDTPREYENKPGIFKNAPEMEETYYKVKKVIE